jgi:hypothetical protein
MASSPAGYRAAGLVHVRAQPRTWPAALTLFVIAAVIPESVATFNSPPLLLLTHPQVLVFLCGFYGSVALLVREFIRRRSPRWAAVLLLGIAAGAVNEGIIAGTWYKAQYPGYTMIGPVDPAVAVGLTVFHALVSTVLPILLAELMFPAVAGRPWLRPRSSAGCVIALTLTAATGFVPAAHRGPRAVVLVAVLATVAVAVALPAAGARPAGRRPPPRPALLGLAGAAAIVAFYLIFAVVPGLLAHAVPAVALPRWQLLPAVLMAGFFALVVVVARNWSARPGWGPADLLSVITGVLLPPAALSLVLPAALRELEPLATGAMIAVVLSLRDRAGRRSDDSRSR